MAKPFESRIQDLVYNVDVGIGLRLIKFSLYILFILVVMLLYTVIQFKGLDNAEAMDYAQAGRNLAERHRFLTQCIRPASMWCMIEKSRYHDPMIDAHPDILHAPVYPAILAAGFKATGVSFVGGEESGAYPPERWVIIPINHFFTLMTGIVIFILALRLFDKKVAWLGTSMFFLSNMVWQNSIMATGLSLVTFFVTFSILMAVIISQRSQEGASFRKLIVPYLFLILTSVLAVLTRYGAIVAIPALALFLAISMPRRGWRWAVALLLLVLIGISPWLIRNKLVSGGILGLAPYTALEDTGVFSGNTFMRSLAPQFAFGDTLKSLQAKWMRGFAEFYATPLRTLGNGLLICLFLTTYFYRFIRPSVQRLRWSILLGILLLAIIAPIFGESTVRLLNMFWPLVLLYGLAFFFILLDRMQFKLQFFNMAVTTIFVILCALPLIFSLLPPRKGIPYPPYFPPYINHVCGLLDPDEMICTDMPWATAWYGRRLSLEIPVNIDEFYEINDYIKKVSGLYFTSLTRDLPYVSSLTRGPYQSWFPILEGRVPTDFPLTEGFPIADMKQLFLTDRPRWQERR